MPGETGEVVITDLNNYCMPFIRYRIGDLATASNGTTCSCGRGLPKIQHIQGRVQSIIIGANGNYIPGALFGHLFKDYYFCVKQYQVIQTQLSNITLIIVKASRFDSEIFNKILDVVIRLGLKESGYRLISNSGSNGGQEVFHYHIHIIGGEPLGSKIK